ncbi:MAG: CRISPR-associated protein Cas4 [Syntrophales bacterium]|jgi:CRISPR-associated exonuclease Cas4|nr:CRISPR-associated protein Cas4 [Syntrophales bacterium]MDY0043547.1 CRISPR-associated protein Cas4 [Syntrophales bacterium]
MYTEDDLLPISALQHMIFCPRQCALIHVEQVWDENRLTAEGRLMHERVHEEGNELRGNVLIERGVSLRSLRLGLIGKADVIEFQKQPDGMWRPFPIEFKRGKPKKDNSDKVQLCAQAICLEEMLKTSVNEGALFYGRTRRRVDVHFDIDLRKETEEAAIKVRQLLDSGHTPKPEYSKRCENCSMMASCLPKPLQKRRTVKSYLKRVLGDL